MRAISDWWLPTGLYRIQGGYEVTSSGTPVSVARKDNMSPSGCSQTGFDLDALILLHELGHQMGKLAPDAGDPKANAANTAAVKAACF